MDERARRSPRELDGREAFGDAGEPGARPAVVSRAVSSRSTLPVLANVLLRTEDAGLKLTATNLEIGITVVGRPARSTPRAR